MLRSCSNSPQHFCKCALRMCCDSARTLLRFCLGYDFTLQTFAKISQQSCPTSSPLNLWSFGCTGFSLQLYLKIFQVVLLLQHGLCPTKFMCNCLLNFANVVSFCKISQTLLCAIGCPILQMSHFGKYLKPHYAQLVYHCCECLILHNSHTLITLTWVACFSAKNTNYLQYLWAIGCPVLQMLSTLQNFSIPLTVS